MADWLPAKDLPSPRVIGPSLTHYLRTLSKVNRFIPMDITMAISERDFGNLESKVLSIEEDVSEVKSDVKQILGKMSSMDGGWKMLAATASIAAAAGGLLVKILPMGLHL